MVQKGRGKKRSANDKGKGKVKGDTKAKRPQTQSKAKPPKEGICFFSNKPGHWKRNCKLYLEDLKKKKGSETTASGIHVIQVNLSTSKSWVLDTGCGSHICVNVQGLKQSRKLAKSEVDLCMANGARVLH